MTSLLEVYSILELTNILSLRLQFLTSERLNTVDKTTNTYSSLWHTTAYNPELVSLLLLLEEYPQIQNTASFVDILQSPLVECGVYTVLDRVYQSNRLSAIELGHTIESTLLVYREYYQLSVSNFDATLFRPINDPLSGRTLMSDKYIQFCMSELAGKWVSELDYSKCVITGSMVAACITSVTWSTTPSALMKFYPSVYTTSSNNKVYTNYRSLTGSYCGNHKQLNVDSINSSLLTCTLYDEDDNSDTEEVAFEMSPGVDVNVYISPDCNTNEVVNSIYTIVKKYYNRATLSTNSGEWVITSPHMPDYLNGFRTVSMRVANKYSVLQHDVPCTRAFYNGTTILSTPSCNANPINVYIDREDYHVFLGDMKEVKQKYHERGYLSSGAKHSKTRKYNVVDEYSIRECKNIPEFSALYIQSAVHIDEETQRYPYPDEIREELIDIATAAYNDMNEYDDSY